MTPHFWQILATHVMGSSASTTSIPNRVGATKTATQNPTIKVHQPNADQKKSPKSETSSNMTEQRHSKDIENDDDDDDFLRSKKSSSDFDDDAFEKFCGEIDTVLKGHSSVIGASHRKSSVSSSVDSGAGLAGIRALTPRPPQHIISHGIHHQ